RGPRRDIPCSGHARIACDRHRWYRTAGGRDLRDHAARRSGGHGLSVVLSADPRAARGQRDWHGLVSHGRTPREGARAAAAALRESQLHGERRRGLVVGFALFGSVTYMPLFLQVVQGASPTASGLEMVPMMGGMLLTSI